MRHDRARACLDALYDLKNVHTNTDGYLGVVWKAAQVGATKTILDPLPEFFSQLLGVAGGPAEYPYVRLFSRFARSTDHPRWRRYHLAGSFGNSGRKPFGDIMTISGERSDIQYRLDKGHAEAALNKLCKGVQIPAYPLALFLYRDLAFDLDTPTTTAWVEHFQEEFGYLDKAGVPTDDYRTLFGEDVEAYAPADDWLTSYDPKTSVSADTEADGTET